MRPGCTLSLFYIKPQPSKVNRKVPKSCTLSLFYIKPQLVCVDNANIEVVPYHFSTSNHNRFRRALLYDLLYLITFLHQTTTKKCDDRLSDGCTLSLFYIKPQPSSEQLRNGCCCTLSLFYIKPQPRLYPSICAMRCTLSLFYIKPQL